MIKESINLIGPEKSKTGTQILPSFDPHLYAKNLVIDSFIPEIFLIKISFSLIGWEAQLATPNQNWSSEILAFLMVISIQTIYGFSRFLAHIFMIK